MRLAADHFNAPPSPAVPADPTAPDVGALVRDPAAALQSFYGTVERVLADNPVAVLRLMELAGRARSGRLSDAERAELQALTGQATRQGRAVAAAIGFFLKFKPYPMLEEIRRRERVFQPAFGPLLVVDGNTVRDVLERHHDFTVEPYGVEMRKVMSPLHNGGFDTFVLSTDDDAAYEPDKRLLAAVCNRTDAETLTAILHDDCLRRMGAALATARGGGLPIVDVVLALARFVPVTLGHRYLGVPVAAEPGTYELTPEMLMYYGTAIDGDAATALAKEDGVIPDERQMYLWIKAAFRHFFNNVQKDRAVQVDGLRSCRQLLAYLLREIGIQRERVLAGQPVDDTMLTRLLLFQMGRSAPAVPRPADLDPRLVSDLRIAENVMGTIVGAVAGQEEATCRVIDSLMRLKEGEYRTSGPGPYRYGSYDEARRLALDVMSGRNVRDARSRLLSYFREALRLQPQGEVLLRKCVRDGVRIADSRPISAGTFVFAAHGSAMKDVPEPDAFILDRPPEHYLHYGWGRHTCLGQFVSPVIIVESMIAVLGLEGLMRPDPKPGDQATPFERRFGRLQLDDQNLYATTFCLGYADSGTTCEFWPAARDGGAR
jgi:cytochrome P450